MRHSHLLTLPLLLLLPTLVYGQQWRFMTFEHTAGTSNGAGVAIVVGSHGGMLRTDDGGARWDHVPSGSYHNQFSALFLDMRRVLVGADSGVMLTSDDTGVTWSEQRLLTTRAIAGLTRRAGDEVLAYTRDEVFLSTDDGESWSPLSGFPLDLRRVIFTTPSTAVALTVDGRLHRSHDGGSSWIVVMADTSARLHDLVFHRDGELGVAGGDFASLRVTSDGGATWRGVDGPNRDLDIRAVTIDTAGRLAVGGLARENFMQVLYTSTDTGRSWTTRTLRPSMNYLILNRFVAMNAETTLALCNGGTLYSFTDNGARIDTITDSRYRRPTLGAVIGSFQPGFHDSIGLVDSDDMFGGYLRTTDNGATWRIGNLGGDDFFEFDLFENGWGLVFRSPQFSGTFHTSNAGITWARHGTETEPNPGHLSGIQTHFFTARDGVAAASGGTSQQARGYFLRTDDSARSYLAQARPEFSSISDLTFANRDTGLLAGVRSLWDDNGNIRNDARQEVIMLTEDGGETWRAIYDRQSNWVTPAAVVMPRPGTIIASVSGDAFGHEMKSSLIRSDDLGRSWREVYTLDEQPNDRILDIAAFTDKLLYAVGMNGLVLRSEDGGETWAHDAVSRRGYDTVFNTYELLQGVHHPHHYNHVSLLDDGRTGIITSNAGILRIVFPDSLVSSVVEAESGDASIGAATLRVIPNPATSTIRLRVRGAAGASSVVLVDNLGRVVLRGAMPEEGGAVIDVSGLAVGFYRAVVYDADGRSVATSNIAVVR